MIPSENWRFLPMRSKLLLTNAPRFWSRNAAAITYCGADWRVCFERMIDWEIFWRSHQQEVQRVKAIEFQLTTADDCWRAVRRRYVSQECYENDGGVPDGNPVRLRSGGERVDEMSDATVMLAAIEGGDREAAEKLLVLVYDELR